MASLFAEAGAIIRAFFTNDAWEISRALGAEGAWLAGLAALLLGAVAVLTIYRFVPFLDRHFERTIMVYSYLIIAGVIFVEVFRRFVLSEQAPWSTTLPPFLFLIMTWFGCSYNVRLRTHLAFAELRANLSPRGQLFCLCADAVLWLGFCWVVVVGSARVTANSAANFQIMLGTDDILQWWFLATVPLSFIILAARVLENVLEDFANYRSGRPLMVQAVIGAD
jgi:TRAP-type C4-dicarboxylate transport system permease small subunit